jgi:hypothetical protein
MVLDAFLVIGGLLLAALTLSDVFDTVVVPGGSKASLQVAQRLIAVLLPVWKRTAGRRRGLSGMFAPVALVGSFVIWMALLMVGFGMLAYAARNAFDPPLKSFWDALYFVGSSMLTLGLSETDALGPARWIIVGAGFCGLAIMTMAVTYLLLVQSSVADRDTGILKLNTSAGNPPSALTLLEKFAAVRLQRDLPDALREARNWCATVRQSHSSHPSLIYFQSIGAGAGWPAALGALVDLALIAEHLLDDEALYGPAILLGEEARGTAVTLARVVRLHPKLHATDESDLRQVAGRLEQSGYKLHSRIHYAALADRRAHDLACVQAMASHLGKPSTILLRS